jgi:hypothetical protein
LELCDEEESKKIPLLRKARINLSPMFATMGVGTTVPSNAEASHLSRATPQAMEVEAATILTPIMAEIGATPTVLNIDQRESLTVHAEAETREKSAPVAETKINEAVRPTNIQSRSKAANAGPSNMPPDSIGFFRLQLSNIWPYGL